MLKKISYKITILLLTLSFIPIVLLAQGATPLEAKFFANKLTITEGETLNLNLYVYPDNLKNVVTISNDLYYPPEFLSFLSSNFPDGWVELRTSPEYLTDTSSGLIRRTAGYINSLTKPNKYISYSFVALKPGTAKLNVQGRFALNNEGKNIGLTSKFLEITIIPKELPKSSDNIEVQKKPTEPKNDTKINKEENKEVSVDLNMEVDGRVAIYSNEDYILNVTIDRSSESEQGFFGDINVSIRDSNKNEIFNQTSAFSDKDLFKKFIVPKNILKEGNYFITTTLSYADKSKQIVRYKELGVLGFQSQKFFDYKTITLLLFLIISIIAAIYHIFRDHEYIASLRERIEEDRRVFVSRSRNRGEILLRKSKE